MLLPLLLAVVCAGASLTQASLDLREIALSPGLALEPKFSPSVTNYRVVLYFNATGGTLNVTVETAFTAAVVPSFLAGVDGDVLTATVTDTVPTTTRRNYTFRFERRGPACGGDLLFCSEQGDCEPGPTEAEDVCVCFLGFQDEACNSLNVTWDNFISSFVIGGLLAGAGAIFLSLLFAASQGFSGAIFNPMSYALYLQQVELFIGHNPQSRNFFDPYQIMNFMNANLYRDEGGTQRNGSWFVWMHGITRKWGILLVVVFLYRWLPGRYLVTCVYKTEVKPHHLTWMLFLLATPLLESVNDLTASEFITPEALNWLWFSVWIVGVWVFAMVVVRPQLTDDVRLFLLPAGDGWGSFKRNPGRRLPGESFCGMIRRNLGELCSKTYVRPGERRHRKRWRWRLWAYASEEEARKHYSKNELEEMVVQRGPKAVLRPGVDAAAEARARAQSEAAVATFDDAAALEEAELARHRKEVLEDFRPIANLSAIKTVRADDADEDAIQDEEADAWAKFGHQNFFTRIAYYAPMTDEEYAAATPLQRAVRYVRSTAGLYWTFVELSFVGLVVLFAIWNEGEAQPRQMMYVLGVELGFLLLVKPYKNDEIVNAVLTRCALIAQLWMFRRMIRDRVEVGLMLPIAIIQVALLLLLWLSWVYFNQDLESERRRRHAVIVMKGRLRRRRADAKQMEAARAEEERLRQEAAEEAAYNETQREIEIKHTFPNPYRPAEPPPGAKWFVGRDPALLTTGMTVTRTVVVHRPPSPKFVADYDAIDVDVVDEDGGPSPRRRKGKKKHKKHKKKDDSDEQGERGQQQQPPPKRVVDDEEEEEEEHKQDSDDDDDRDDNDPLGNRLQPSSSMTGADLAAYIEAQSEQIHKEKQYQSTQRGSTNPNASPRRR